MGICTAGSYDGMERCRSPEALRGGTSVSGQTLFDGSVPNNIEVVENRFAHLSLSLRSHRAQRIASWVNAVITPDAREAANNLPNQREFPLCITRHLEAQELVA